MMSDPRARALLIVALVLAAVRFALMPWLEWQGEKREALQVLTQRLDRSEGLVRSRSAIERNATALFAESQKAKAVFPVVTSGEAFRLQSQQQLTALAQQFGVSVKVFDVLTEGDVDRLSLRFIRVRLQVEGAARFVARFHGEIEGRMQNAIVRSVRFESNVVPLVAPGEAIVQAALMADLYYFAGPPAAGKTP